MCTSVHASVCMWGAGGGRGEGCCEGVFMYVYVSSGVKVGEGGGV